jgi:hypothetical protein
MLHFEKLAPCLRDVDKNQVATKTSLTALYQKKVMELNKCCGTKLKLADFKMNPNPSNCLELNGSRTLRDMELKYGYFSICALHNQERISVDDFIAVELKKKEFNAEKAMKKRKLKADELQNLVLGTTSIENSEKVTNVTSPLVGAEQKNRNNLEDGLGAEEQEFTKIKNSSDGVEVQNAVAEGEKNLNSVEEEKNHEAPAVVALNFQEQMNAFMLQMTEANDARFKTQNEANAVAHANLIAANAAQVQQLTQKNTELVQENAAQVQRLTRTINDLNNQVLLLNNQVATLNTKVLVHENKINTMKNSMETVSDKLLHMSLRYEDDVPLTHFI